MRSRARAVRPERLAGWWINRDSIFMRRPVAVAPCSSNRTDWSVLGHFPSLHANAHVKCQCRDRVRPRTLASTSTSNSNRRREEICPLYLPRRTLLTPARVNLRLDAYCDVLGETSRLPELTSTKRKNVHRGWMGLEKPPSPSPSLSGIYTYTRHCRYPCSPQGRIFDEPSEDLAVGEPSPRSIERSAWVGR